MPEVWCAPGKIYLRCGDETQVNNRMNATRTFYYQKFSKPLLRELAALRLIGTSGVTGFWSAPHFRHQRSAALQGGIVRFMTKAGQTDLRCLRFMLAPINRVVSLLAELPWMLKDIVSVNQYIPSIVSTIRFQNILRKHLISAKPQPDLFTG